jgi:hypothetical protein
MRSTATRIWILAAAVAAALGIAQPPALGAPDTTATISISAKSAQKPVTRDVFVVFKSRTLSHAQIKGSVSGAATGQVLQLFAQQFPFKKAPAKLDSAVTLTGASMPYSFSATPTLATRYHVELFTDSSETSMVAKSAVRVVFVTSRGHWSRVQSCNRRGQRPVCHQRLHLTLTVPPSTLRAEQRKRFHLYFGLKLDRSGSQPGPPRRLKLGGGHGRIISVKKLNAQQYLATMTFSFRIGSAGYYFLVGACQQDTEAADGLNLPGHHGCGDRFISAKIPYLG